MMIWILRSGLLLILLLSISAGLRSQNELIFSSVTGKVQFSSSAPLELIEAFSNKLQGAINPSDQTFAFSVVINSFDGFNSPLQREHFNENYMESHEFPKATFLGKIIEDIDFQKDGDYEIRAKGVLQIHGIEQDRIIKCNIKINNGEILANSTFTILLSEHDISIPKVVYQKICEEILVVIETRLISK